MYYVTAYTALEPPRIYGPYEWRWYAHLVATLLSMSPYTVANVEE